MRTSTHTDRVTGPRQSAREAASRQAGAAGECNCIGILSYVDDQARRDLARRLTHTRHDHRVMSSATLHLHVHLDSDQGLKATIMRGQASLRHSLASRLSVARGVRYGDLRLVAKTGESTDDGHAGAVGHRHNHDDAA